MMETMIGRSIIWVLLIFLIMPLAASYVISWLTMKSQRHLMLRFGQHAPFIFSWLGTIVHELAHALLALLFGHHLDKIVLLTNPFKSDKDRRLGYVDHSWHSHNLYQRLGNFFIGLAPMLVISLVTGIITQILWPNLFDIQTLGWHVFVGVPGWQIVIWICLIFNLNLGMNISSADWHNVWQGLTVYIMFLLIVGLILGLFIIDDALIWETVGYWLAMTWLINFGISLVIMGLTSILV
ncbi:MAG: hypothetical protein ACTIMJ_03025 [Weissella hellenica]|uniref:hypothetical protein n=1 Tax=Weissella hellenica TaxID=46256 RepID=UPI003F9710CD